jgi:hypothetical protein
MTRVVSSGCTSRRIKGCRRGMRGKIASCITSCPTRIISSCKNCGRRPQIPTPNGSTV